MKRRSFLSILSALPFMPTFLTGHEPEDREDSMVFNPESATLTKFVDVNNLRPGEWVIHNPSDVVKIFD